MQVSALSFIYAVPEKSEFWGSANSVGIDFDFDFPGSAKLAFKLDAIIKVFVAAYFFKSTC